MTVVPVTSEPLDGRSTRAERLRRVRREKILKAAERVFGQEGYHNTSITDVIEAAGISRGTFYLYFASKDELFYELVDGFARRLIDSIRVVDPTSANPTVDMLENIRHVVGLLFDHRDLTKLLLKQAQGVDEKVDLILKNLYGLLHEMVVGALENGAQWGLTRRVNSQIVATAIVGCIKEVLYQYLVEDREDLPEKEAVAVALFEFGLRGLLPNS